MWHDLSHGESILNDSATEPPLTSVPLEFQQTPTAGWPQCSMIVFMFGGFCVVWPGTSTKISTPASAAALPQGTSDLPICSSVFSTDAPRGTVFGRTFTPFAPRSWARPTNCLHSSMFFLTTDASGD